MACKSLVSIAALLVEILDMIGAEGAEEGVQVITLVTLNLWVWGFRVQPITTRQGTNTLAHFSQ